LQDNYNRTDTKTCRGIPTKEYCLIFFKIHFFTQQMVVFIPYLLFLKLHINTTILYKIKICIVTKIYVALINSFSYSYCIFVYQHLHLNKIKKYHLSIFLDLFLSYINGALGEMYVIIYILWLTIQYSFNLQNKKAWIYNAISIRFTRGIKRFNKCLKFVPI